MALGDNGRPTVQELATRYAVESEMIGRNPQKGLPAYAWPGGYPLVYTDEYNGTLCADCASNLVRELARETDDDEHDMVTKVADWYIYYEGPTMLCDECNAEIASAYGNPFEDENQEENAMPEHAGTVSWGTMRVQDLTAKFMGYLADHAPEAYQKINAEFVALWGSAVENFGDDSVIWDTEFVHFLLNEDIWEAMQELAPDGLYFGAHPGDGSDYGYWAAECEC